jgi:hypothetical protein
MDGRSLENFEPRHEAIGFAIRTELDVATSVPSLQRNLGNTICELLLDMFVSYPL